MGGGAPASEHRGTVVEAEATLSRRVAAEAEAGKPTVSHALSEERGREVGKWRFGT